MCDAVEKYHMYGKAWGIMSTSMEAILLKYNVSFLFCFLICIVLVLSMFFLR